MKLPQCDTCQFYSHSIYMVCAVHPCGVTGNECLDFRPKSDIQFEESWTPEGYAFYNGELIRQPRQMRTPSELMELLDTHPLFTGYCPRCNYQFERKFRSVVHWDCPNCGWVDDSV